MCNAAVDQSQYRFHDSLIRIFGNPDTGNGNHCPEEPGSTVKNLKPHRQGIISLNYRPEQMSMGVGRENREWIIERQWWPQVFAQNHFQIRNKNAYNTSYTTP